MANHCATMPHMANENTVKTQLNVIHGKRVPAIRQENRKDSRASNVNRDKIIHDFRSSLNIIIGYSELMLDEVMGKMNEEQRESLKDILKNGECLLALVNDISARWDDCS